MLTKLVRKTAIISALALSVLSVASQKSLANQAVFISNQNRQLIYGIFVKLPDSNHWQSILGLITPGEVLRLNLNTNQCVIDFKMRYYNDSFDQGRYNICKRNTLVYTGNGGDYSPSRSTANGNYIPQWGAVGGGGAAMIRDAGNGLANLR